MTPPNRPAPVVDAPLPTVGSHWLHRKSGGTYYIVAVGKIEADLTPAVVYRSTYDDKIWVRPLVNFMDGRFEQTPDPRAAPAPDLDALLTDFENAIRYGGSAHFKHDQRAAIVSEFTSLRERVAELEAALRKACDLGIQATDTAEKQCATIRQTCEDYFRVEARATAAEAALAKCRGALEFYADPGKFTKDVPDFYSELDFGDRAREALKGDKT